MNTVKFFAFLGLLLCNVSLLLGQETPEPTAAPNVKLLYEALEMPQLKRTRRIWIYLPPDYESSNTQYPVMYLQDGQNLFDEAIAHKGREWKVDETLNAFFEEGLEGIIVVGIEHGNEHRGQEYAPWVRDTNGVTEGGEGDEYVDFLVNTLKPLVDSNFRTKSGREHTGIGGSSLGGLIAFYAALKYPKVFGKAGVISPAFWFNPEIIEYAQKQPVTHETRYYFVISEEEGLGAVGRVHEAYEALLAQGHSPDQVKEVLTSTGSHNEVYFGERFPEMYLWLFEPQQRSSESEDPEEPEEPEEPTGLDDVDATLAGISLYPNPVSAEFRLRLPDAWKARSQGYVMDIHGRIVSPLQALHDGMSLSVEALPSGLFFLIITTDTQRAVLRLLKE